MKQLTKRQKIVVLSNMYDFLKSRQAGYGLCFAAYSVTFIRNASYAEFLELQLGLKPPVKKHDELFWYPDNEMGRVTRLRLIKRRINQLQKTK